MSHRIDVALPSSALAEVAAALDDAFADYPVRLHFSEAALREMITGEGVRLSASCCARGADGALLGVGLGALRGTRGRVAAMGVVRAAQGSGIGERVGEALLAALHRAGATDVVLEALTINAPALSLYEDRLGFVRRRRLVGFARPPGGPAVPDDGWRAALHEAGRPGGEPPSWQLPRLVARARATVDLVSVPAVVPEHHPVADLLRGSGFVETEIDQYELARPLP